MSKERRFAGEGKYMAEKAVRSTVADCKRHIETLAGIVDNMEYNMEAMDGHHMNNTRRLATCFRDLKEVLINYTYMVEHDKYVGPINLRSFYKEEDERFDKWQKSLYSQKENKKSR